MNPRLVIITGPLQGTAFKLPDSASIGRDPENAIRIKQASVSRRHCTIRREGERFRIIDLSSYGTFVNRLPVNEALLEHGDHISVGESVLLFLLHDDEVASTHDSIQFERSELSVGSTLRLRAEDAFYLQPGRLEASQAGTRVTHDLNALLKISRSINSVRSAESLQQQLLESVLEVVPAERGAVLFLKDSLDAPISTFTLDRGHRREASPLRISRTVVEQALRERTAIMSNTAGEDALYQSAESLTGFQTRSLLCAPLINNGRVFGIIYLISSRLDVTFDERHLELFAAIAGIAAVAVENILHTQRLVAENQRLHEEVNLTHNLVGDSARMREVNRLIASVAPADSNVLIRGESGTGKELVAHAIHENSLRSGQPFIAINCASLTDSLLESELFGHEKGAFTGAVALKRGKFEVADGGTVFLDEVGELNPQLQARLLRVLQERAFERVGGVRRIEVNIRLIAATNKELEEAIKRGSFREDLYYRLNVVEIVTPPLRERREDVPLLANYFVAKYSEKCKKRVRGLSPEAYKLLTDYHWPGNVRELENTIERAMILEQGEIISAQSLPERILKLTRSGRKSGVTPYNEAVKEAKRQIILSALIEADGNYTEAARLLAIPHTNNLYRLIKNLGIQTDTKT